MSTNILPFRKLEYLPTSKELPSESPVDGRIDLNDRLGCVGSDDVYGMTVEGDYEAGQVYDGDLLIVNRDAPARIGELVVVNDAGTATVKHFRPGDKLFGRVMYVIHSLPPVAAKKGGVR